MIEREHRVRLAAAKVGLELHHRVAAIAREPLHSSDQESMQALGKKGSADELDGMMSELKKNGVKIVEPIFITPNGGRAFFIEGPDRVLIEIIAIPSSQE